MICQAQWCEMKNAKFFPSLAQQSLYIHTSNTGPPLLSQFQFFQISDIAE